MTPWTRLEGTAIWEKAKAEYQRDSRRIWHAFNHILRRYEIAAALDIPYDINLDLAILCHDVIFDEFPQKEARSAQWLVDEIGSLASRKPCELIMTTETHMPGSDNRMIMIDLYDLLSESRTQEDREMIRLESMALYGITSEQFDIENRKFFAAMSQRYDAIDFSTLPRQDQPWFELMSKRLKDIVKAGDAAIAAHND